MTDKYNLQPPPIPEPQEPKKLLTPQMIGAIAGGVFIIFLLGILIGSIVSSRKPSLPVATVPTPTQSPLQQPTTPPDSKVVSEVPQIQFLLNKQYLDDTYVVITKDSPHLSLVVSASRIEQDRGFAQYTKANFFDGKEWLRRTTTTYTLNNQITPNILVTSWKAANTISEKEPQSIATLRLLDRQISFTSSSLDNEITIQSTPGLTKFIYQGSGSLTFDEETYPAYVFYSRTYSFNASDLSYLTKPELLNSDWFIFWDKEDSFYYLDSHDSSVSTVPKFTVGVNVDQQGFISRTANVSAKTLIQSDVSTYSVNYKNQNNEDVFLGLSNAVNKSDSKKYSWTQASGKGRVIKKEGRTVEGIGIAEFIRQN